MTDLVSRQAWGADNVALEPMPLVPVKTVVLHHTATAASNDGAKDMRNIENGEQAMGYTTIAYHECGHPSGSVYEGRGVKHKGAATLGRNSDTLAYSFIGNFQNIQPTDVALEACSQRLAEWVRQGRLTKDFALKPHSDFFATACCGSKLKPKIPGIRARVSAILDNGPVLNPQPGSDTSSNNPVSAQAPPYGGLLLKGSKGGYVRQAQQKLRDRGWNIAVDGSYGPKTEAIVRLFQKDKRLAQDGIVGPATWKAIFTSPIT